MRSAIAALLQNRSLRVGSLALAGALLFTFWFNAALLDIGDLEARSIYPPSTAAVLRIVEPTILVGLVFAFLLVASRWQRGFVAAVVALFAVSAVPAYFTRTYHISLRVAVESVLDWSDKEGILLLGWQWLTWLALAVAAAAALGAAIRRAGAGTRTRPSGWITVAAAAVTIGALAVDAAYFDGRGRARVWLDYLPLGLVSQTWHYAAATRAYGNKVDISRWDYRLHAANRDLVFAFVIGESTRAANFSLNGYPRRTNPELEGIANVVSFTDASSAATSTRKSVPVLMTRITAQHARPLMTRFGGENDVYVPETSFISIFNKLGFATSFLANWSPYGPWSTSETIFAQEAGYAYFPSSWDALTDDQRAARRRALGVRDVARFEAGYDENLLLVLEQRLAADGAGRSLVVMHPYGSHFQYKWYPKEFERFTPVCDFARDVLRPEQCGPSLVNSYDNTILYADWMLSQIIARLRQRNAVLLYVGDHAESLGESGLYMHSHDRPWEKHVPLIVWASERYLADPDNHAKFEALRANRNLPVTHDFVFHTVLDLAGIESAQVLRPELSLARPLRP